MLFYCTELLEKERGYQRYCFVGDAGCPLSLEIPICGADGFDNDGEEQVLGMLIDSCLLFGMNSHAEENPGDVKRDYYGSHCLLTSTFAILF